MTEIKDLSSPDYHKAKIAELNNYRAPEFANEGVTEHVSNSLAEIWQEFSDFTAEIEERLSAAEKALATKLETESVTAPTTPATK